MDNHDLVDPGSQRILFAHAELQCPETKVVKLNPLFEAELIKLRMEFATPMRVTSCCRSKEYNESIGGHPRSLHVYKDAHHHTGGACAVDIAISHGHYAHQLAHIAFNFGWSIGRGKDFIHLDRRDVAGLPTSFFSYG